MKVQFKGKPQPCVGYSKELVAYEFNGVKVPEIKRHHCDMAAFRNSRKFGAYANSDMFPAMINRAVKEAVGNKQYLNVDRPPEGVEIDAKGFLAVVTIDMSVFNSGGVV